MALLHGGQLQQVATQYNIPLNDWIDVSTGIAPISYPIPDIPLSVWQQLPQQNLALITAAQQYYQCSQLMITNGSQAIIKALPALYGKKNTNSQDVYLPERGYKEHAQAWKNAGYHLHFYQESLPVITDILPNSVLVIINPNNPTGKFYNAQVINKYRQQLEQLDGLLVLDEAFIDVMSDTVLVNQPFASQTAAKKYNQPENNHTLILRSFGKFFGLAGIRIGFLLASSYWCEAFKELVGPWQVNGPAQLIAQYALQDTSWQAAQKENLNRLRVMQENLLRQAFPQTILHTINGCDLFLTLSFHQQDTAKKLYKLLCQQGIYCRLADEQDTLRFGLTTEEFFMRLTLACERAAQQLS
ncbi:threonine-phosphate decarboxylase CobD [Colwellia psychrerythraea]|uniref:threonine-phosphate decarboxylase n=1 Tax=Colwellia psychrerythraea TaxID=28229 RepID=A0A099KA94_COLPS|nr:threonine-phosphate decarboxylase CobD [Colwellia psychrerythraea]KGJ87200.1 L-threonine-O-3-phosphate decarboxylase [Colwellia psychrerythraea]